MTEGTEPVESEAADDAAVDETPESEAPQIDELARWKARSAGKDRALTEQKKELEQAKKDLALLSKWKAEREQADLSEVDRLNLRIKELEDETAAAKREASLAQLAREFPLAFDLLGEDAPLDKGRLTEIEDRLKAKSEPEEPRIDPNQPRRATGAAKPNEEKTREELLDDLTKHGNPFATPAEAFVPFRAQPR